MKFPNVSVIVLNRNGKRYLKRCFQSLRNQTYPNFEVIMVDNASSDGSVGYVKRVFPWVKVIRNNKNLGFAGGNNVGIRQAEGDLIALFNNDAEADKNWLKVLVDTIMGSRDIGIVGGKIYYLNPRDKVWFDGGVFHPFLGTIAPLRQRKEGNSKITEVDWITGCAILFKKEIIDRVGSLDDEYLIYFEDVDFCLRAKKAGKKVVYNANAIAWHGEGGATKQWGSKKFYIEYQSKFRFILKNLTVPQIISALIFQLIFVTIYELIVLKRRYTLEKIRAFIWNMRKLRKIMRARRS